MTLLEQTVLYVIVFAYGIVIGSFLNVCIYRIPKEENIIKVGSHCMNCNHKLRWYDLFPLFSWLFLKGKCRYCGAKISCQYPIVEALNGILYIIIFAVNGTNIDSALYSVMVSALLVISVIDYRTMMIPVGADIVILAVGVIHLVLHLNDWLYYVIGFLSVGLFLLLCALVFRAVTGKSGLGLGDVELMACASLCIGAWHGLFAIIVGSVLGVIVEGAKIIITKEKGRFPFAPYLAVGVLVALLWGSRLYDWYMTWIMG